MSTLQFSVDQINPKTCVLWMQGSADIAAHDELKSYIQGVSASPSVNVVLDIRQLSFLNSLALGEMFALARAKASKKGKVAFVGPNEYIRGVFTKAKVTSVIPVFDTVEDAIKSIG